MVESVNPNRFCSSRSSKPISCESPLSDSDAGLTGSQSESQIRVKKSGNKMTKVVILELR